MYTYKMHFIGYRYIGNRYICYRYAGIGRGFLDKLEGNRASAKIVQFIKYISVNCLLS